VHKRTLQRLFPAAKFDEPLRRYTAWKIGGPADALLEPLGASELIEAVETAREHDVPVTILGGGTNVLILDGGIRGLTIRLARALTDVTITGTSVVADAGVLYRCSLIRPPDAVSRASSSQAACRGRSGGRCT
jgi:UDP-N-acetylmuramate dehydrogenase